MRSQIGRPFSMAATDGLGLMANISSPLSVNISCVQNSSSISESGCGLSGSWGWSFFASLTNPKPCGVGFFFFAEGEGSGEENTCLLSFSLPLVRAEELIGMPSAGGAGVMGLLPELYRILRLTG